MLIFQQTEEFRKWLSGLRDPLGKAQILIRIRRAQMGNFGDHKFLGNGISEMRIDCGPGYRIYYMRSGDIVYFLLNGGDKNSQQSDIAKAIELAKLMRGGV